MKNAGLGVQGFILSLAGLETGPTLWRFSSTNGTWNGFRAVLSSGRRGDSRVPPYRRILIMKLLWRFVLASVPLCAQVSPTINELPSREFGQVTLTNPATSAAPNLVEGREFSTPLGMAFSPSGGAVYVSDTNNHRVLAWLHPSGLTKGNKADKV